LVKETKAANNKKTVIERYEANPALTTNGSEIASYLAMTGRRDIN